MDETQELKGKKKGKWIILAIVLVALVAIGIICFITLGNTPEKRFRKQMDLGNKYLEEMEYEKAVAAFEAAIEIDPNNADAYVGLAKAYLGLGDLEKARKAFKKAIKLNPDYAEEYADLAKALGLDQKAEADKKETDQKETDEEQTVASSVVDEKDPETDTEDEPTDKELDEKGRLIALEEEVDLATYVPDHANAGVIIVSQNGEYGAIDLKGNLIVPCKYESYSAVSDTGYFVMRIGPQSTVFSPKGDIIETIEFAYNVWTGDTTYAYQDVNSLIYVCKKYDGTLIYQREFNENDTQTPFSEGKAILLSESKDEYSVLTKDGITTIENADYLSFIESACSQGMLISTSADSDHPRILMISWDGKAVGGVYLRKPIIDADGKLNCRVTGVKDSGFWNPEGWLFLSGNEDEVYDEERDDFVDTVGWRWYAKSGGRACNYGTKMVLLNRDKEILVDLAKLDQSVDFPVYDYIGICDEKYWLVSKDGKWGYCDHDGNIVKLYDDAARFKNGRAFIVEGGTVYLIDESFTVLAEVREGTGVYSSGDLFCIIDRDNITHYYVCTEEELLAQ